MATVRTLIRAPSVAKLADDDIRLILHRKLERYLAMALKENRDFYTHELDATVTYDPTVQGFEFEINLNSKTTNDYIPVVLFYQDTTSDPDTDDWRIIRLVKYSAFVQNSAENRPIAAVIGNTWQGIHNSRFKINLTEEFVTAQRWRIAFRFFPSEVLGINDLVPFPREIMSVIETSTALDCLDLVNDNSPDWEKFAMRRRARLEEELLKDELAMLSWLSQDVECTVVTDSPYHYVYNNPLMSKVTRTRRVECQ